MDLNMPIIDGFESSDRIIKILRDDNNLDYCSIVAMASYTDMDIKERCLRIGMKYMLCKPFFLN